MEIPDFSDLSLWGRLIVVGGSGIFPGTTIFWKKLIGGHRVGNV
jgi:hypothetical protein